MRSELQNKLIAFGQSLPEGVTMSLHDLPVGISPVPRVTAVVLSENGAFDDERAIESVVQSAVLAAKQSANPVDLLKNLGGILTFAGQVATAIRMYTSYNQSGADLERLAPEDLMFLSDTLVSFEFLGEHFAVGNVEKVVYYCDSIAHALSAYIGKPAFMRNPAVDLHAVITHLRGLKSVFAQQNVG